MHNETTVRQVPNNPKTIDRTNNFMDTWGWNVLNVQITDRKTIHEGNSKGRIDDSGIHVETEVYTEHANYATITYQRDLDDSTIKELARLERKYNEEYVTDAKDAAAFNQRTLERKGCIALLLLLVVSVILSRRYLLFDILGYATLFGCPALFIHTLVAPKFLNAKKHDKENYKKYQANREVIFAEAYSLRNGEL